MVEWDCSSTILLFLLVMRVGLFFENGWSILAQFLTEKLLLLTQNSPVKIVAIVARELKSL